MATPRLGLVVEDKPTELSCELLDIASSSYPGLPMFFNVSCKKNTIFCVKLTVAAPRGGGG